MNWGGILVLCILLSLTYVAAEDITLGVGEDYVRNGVKITLARIDTNYQKVVLCVNNEKQIIFENQIAYFNDVGLEVEHIDQVDKSVDIDIAWIKSCTDCVCEGDCLNDKCKIMEYDEFGSPLNPEVEEDTIEEITAGVVKDVEPKKPDYFLFVSLGIFSVFVGIGLVWLSWFRKMSF